MTTQSLDPDYGKRRALFGAWLLLLTSVFIFWVGWHWSGIEHSRFAAGLTRGQILHVAASPQRGFDVLIGYRDASGAQQRTKELHKKGTFQVGEKIWVPISMVRPTGPT